MNEAGLQPNRPRLSALPVVGDVMGSYHPQGDRGSTPRWPGPRSPSRRGTRSSTARATSATSTTIRRPPCGTPSVAPGTDGDGAAPRHRRRHGRPPAELRRVAPGADRASLAVPQPARERILRYRGRHGHEHATAPSRRGRGTASSRLSTTRTSTSNVSERSSRAGLPDGRDHRWPVGIRDAYCSGRGRIVMRARAHVEELRGGKSAIIVSELPYGVKKGGDTGVIRKIADLVNDKVLPEISDIQDHSDKSGMRIQIELKRDAIPQVVLNKLFKHTQLQTRSATTRSPSSTAFRGRCRCSSSFATTSTSSARSSRAGRSTSCARPRSRAHVLQGYLIALDNLDAVTHPDPGVAGRRRGPPRG